MTSPSHNAVFLGKSVVHLVPCMVDEPAEKSIINITVEPDLIPVFLVPMVSTFDAAVLFAQLNGLFRVAFHGHDVGSVKSHAGKDFSFQAKHKDGVVERHVFGDARQ